MGETPPTIEEQLEIAREHIRQQQRVIHQLERENARMRPIIEAVADDPFGQHGDGACPFPGCESRDESGTHALHCPVMEARNILI